MSTVGPAGRPSAKRRPERFSIVVFDGFDELDAIGPFEVLSRLAGEDSRVEVELVALGAPREIVGSHGLRVAVEGAIPPHTDVLLVPGGGWNDRARSGARAEVADGSLPAAVRDAHAGGAIAASVCTGAMILAAAGLLRDRRATTHRAALGDLEAAGAATVDARIVDTGDVVTAGGVTAGIDLGLWLVARSRGRELARHVAARIEHTSGGSVWDDVAGRLLPLSFD